MTPDLADVFAAQAPALCEGLDETSTWDAIMAAEPAGGVRLGDEEVESVLGAIADFINVKSPYTIGHSRGVAGLAGQAAREAGLDEAAARQVRLAGASSRPWPSRSAEYPLDMGITDPVERAAAVGLPAVGLPAIFSGNAAGLFGLGP